MSDINQISAPGVIKEITLQNIMIMDIQNIISQLQSKFGDKFDISAVKEHLKGIDTSKLSFSEIVEKIKGKGLIGDLDGDGVQESAFEEIKGKIGGLFGK